MAKALVFFSMLFMAIHFEATLGFPGKEGKCHETGRSCTYRRPNQQEECCFPDLCRENPSADLGGICYYIKEDKAEGKEDKCQPTYAPCTYHRPDQQEECCEPDICREDSSSVTGGLCGYLKEDKAEEKNDDVKCSGLSRSCVLPNPVLPDQQGDCCEGLKCCSCPTCPGLGKCQDYGAC